DDGLTQLERTSPVRAFTFVLPKSWTESNLKLVATAIGAKGPANQNVVLCLSTSCGNPSETLFSVRFAEPPKASEMFLNALQQPVYHPKDRSTTYVGPSAPRIFEKLVAAYPGTIWWLDPTNTGWRTPRFRAFDVATDTAILEPAIAWDKRIGQPGNGTIGTFVQGENPGIRRGRVAVASARTIGGDTLWRPMTSVAHEVFHVFGFPHAAPCKDGNGKGSGGEAWPLADGRLGGVGLDTTPGSGGKSGPFRVIPDRGPTAPAHDLMSYCAKFGNNDPTTWISVYNWSRAMRRTSGALPPISRISRSGGRASASRAGRTAAVDELAVMARGDAAGVRVTSVDRATRPSQGGTPSTFRLVGRNAAGQVQGVAALTQDDLDGPAGSPPSALLSGQLPRAGVTRVDIVDQTGRTVATQATAATKPTARLVSPRRGSRTGRGANLSVRWRTGPGAQAFRAVIETSANGGRTFQRVWGGPNTGRARIPIGLLRASRAARIRLRVGDGFQEAQATSGRFTLVPRRPSVRIAEPVRGQVVDAGGAVRLFGSATDDRGREIGGRRLRWTAGRTVLGRGADISAALPAGTRRVRLTATSRGRRGSASVAVRVRASTPYFLRLRAKRRGTKTTLTVAASQPARLSVRGKRYGVTTRTKRIRVRVGRKKAVRLRLILSAGGKRSTNTITVRR
ncbi:MAG TPA: hypothetical protein VFY44_05085, partial [Thermoleophilaceae bacterium]|nr:hypothetical protein [Thermoleophilaceae bacterium]